MTKAVYIIAEAGVNHNGLLKNAFNLVDAAAAAGVDAIKFQTFKAENLVVSDAPKAAYQKAVTDEHESQWDMLKRLELDENAHVQLKSYCEKKTICFLSSPFDIESALFLYDLGMPIFKIPSSELNNIPYLRVIGGLGRPVFLSTGMASLDDVRKSLDILISAGLPKEKLTILHCNTAYPTPFEDVNLKAMLTMRDELNSAVGYSDHTPGIAVPVAAVALGATVIEKHFTLSREMPGPDQKASLEPAELTSMVKAIRATESALGHGHKEPSASEKENMDVARKSIIANTTINAGDIFTEQNMTIMRPGTGTSPWKWDEIIGTRSTKSYQKGDPIEQ